MNERIFENLFISSKEGHKYIDFGLMKSLKLYFTDYWYKLGTRKVNPYYDNITRMTNGFVHRMYDFHLVCQLLNHGAM